MRMLMGKVKLVGEHENENEHKATMCKMCFFPPVIDCEACISLVTGREIRRYINTTSSCLLTCEQRKYGTQMMPATAPVSGS